MLTILTEEKWWISSRVFSREEASIPNYYIRLPKKMEKKIMDQDLTKSLLSTVRLYIHKLEADKKLFEL